LRRGVTGARTVLERLRRGRRSTLPSLLQLTDGFGRFGAAEARVAYALSLVAVTFLGKRWGADGPKRVVDEVAAGRPWTDAIRTVTGLAPPEFAEAFERWLATYLGP